MADTDDPAKAASRLEQALERIATLAEQVAAARAAARPDETPANDAMAQPVDTAAVAERLDVLIARLRAALAGRPA